MIYFMILSIGISFSQPIELPKDYKCPPPDTQIYPRLEYKTRFDSKTKVYQYNYTLSNQGGLLAIDTLYIYTAEKPLKIGLPDKIHKEPIENWMSFGHHRGRVGWYTVGDAITASQKVTNFLITNYSKPGIIRYSASGYIEEAPHVAADCPEHFQDLPAEQREIVGATIGPVPDSLNQVDGDLEFHSKNHSGKIPQIDPLDKGEIELYLKDSDQFEISHVDIASLEFGPGKAKVKSHKYIDENGKECSAHDFRRKNKKRKLKLIFKLEDMKVRCNLDYALFLKGKVSGKNLLAAQEMKPVVCEPKHFRTK